MITTGLSEPRGNDSSYEYVGEVVGYTATSDNVVVSGRREDAYHESVLYHSNGPSTSQLASTIHAGSSERGAHMYDDASVQMLQHSDPIYEDPDLSQVCNLAST